MVEAAGAITVVTVGDALVGRLAAATSRGMDALAAAGAVVLAASAETVGLVAPLAGEPSSEDRRRGVGSVDSMRADNDAEVCAGVAAVVEELNAAIVAGLLAVAVALLAVVLGIGVAVVVSMLGVLVPVTVVLGLPVPVTVVWGVFVPVTVVLASPETVPVTVVWGVPVPVTVVLASPETCTTRVRGSVDDDWVEEFVDASLDDDAAPVLGDDDADDADATDEFEEDPVDLEPADVELLDEELLDEELLEEPVESANAITGLLAIATPTPSMTANAPTRPTQLTLPIIAPRWMGMSGA